MRKQKAAALAVVMLFAALVVFSPSVAQADQPVNIKFNTSGLANYSDLVLTIDGTQYTYYTLASTTFKWHPASTHTVAASTPLTAWDGNVYKFTSWTNGDGLTGASGTYTTPSAASTVTANYALTSFAAKFATSGVANFNGQILVIDGTGYTYYDLGSTTFLWVSGTTHSVQAVTPVTGWDNNGWRFSSWTNGNGLVTASGTFTMPGSAVTVTANYVPATVHVRFAESGLSNLNAGQTVLTIDGVIYDFWQLPLTDFQWFSGTTHTVTAATSLTGWDGVSHDFSSWTNGGGLSGATGTYTTPNADATVTVNYILAPAATTLTVSCNPTTVDKTGAATTSISGALTSAGSGVEGKTITLTYSSGGVTWSQLGTTTSTMGGAYSCSWTVPPSMPNGPYFVRASFAGDTGFQASSATTSGGANLMVVPEYAWGALAALAACFAALVVFKKSGALAHKRHK